jgi:hypothetical protein
MSERYGDCRSCGGRGYKVVGTVKAGQVEVTADNVREVLSGLLERGEGLRQEMLKEECGRCGGTGQSGDTQDYRG